MAKDLFSRTAAFGGAFPADFVKLSFGREGDKNGVGALVQRVALTYQQNIARLFELGSGNFYYVGGRAQGEASLDKVLGPGQLIESLIETYGDLCNPQDLQMTYEGGCANNSQQRNGLTISCGSCVATSFGINVAAQDAIVNENIRLVIGWITQFGQRQA